MFDEFDSELEQDYIDLAKFLDEQEENELLNIKPMYDHYGFAVV